MIVAFVLVVYAVLASGALPRLMAGRNWPSGRPGSPSPSGRRPVSPSSPPAFTLGAGGETALIRVLRMLRPEAPLGRAEVVLLVGGPAAMAVLPGISEMIAHHG